MQYEVEVLPGEIAWTVRQLRAVLNELHVIYRKNNKHVWKNRDGSLTPIKNARHLASLLADAGVQFVDGEGEPTRPHLNAMAVILCGADDAGIWFPILQE